MKRLLGIVILSLMWCAVSHSQIYEINKCYSNNGKEAEWKIETWNFVSKEKNNLLIQ